MIAKGTADGAQGGEVVVEALERTDTAMAETDMPDDKTVTIGGTTHTGKTTPDIVIGTGMIIAIEGGRRRSVFMNSPNAALMLHR